MDTSVRPSGIPSGIGSPPLSSQWDVFLTLISCYRGTEMCPVSPLRLWTPWRQSPDSSLTLSDSRALSSQVCKHGWCMHFSFTRDTASQGSPSKLPAFHHPVHRNCIHSFIHSREGSAPVPSLEELPAKLERETHKEWTAAKGDKSTLKGQQRTAVLGGAESVCCGIRKSASSSPALPLTRAGWAASPILMVAEGWDHLCQLFCIILSEYQVLVLVLKIVVFTSGEQEMEPSSLSSSSSSLSGPTIPKS